MGTTIHHTVPLYPMLMGNGRIPDDPYTGFVQQAEQLAKETLNNLELPHRIHRFDRRDSQDQSRTPAGLRVRDRVRRTREGLREPALRMATGPGLPDSLDRRPTSARPATPKKQKKPTELS